MDDTDDESIPGIPGSSQSAQDPLDQLVNMASTSPAEDEFNEQVSGLIDFALANLHESEEHSEFCWENKEK